MTRYNSTHRTLAQHRAEFDPQWCRTLWHRGRRCGFVECEQKADGWYLWDLHISPPLQNKGIGSSLLRRVESEVRAHGGKKIILFVYKNNPAIV